MPLQPTTKDQKFNPLAAHLMHNYYTAENKPNKPKINIPIFNLNSPKDIPLIMQAAQLEGLKEYGVIVVSGGRHRTPMIVQNDNIFILESLGAEKSKVGINSIAQIAMAINSFSQNCKIFCFKKNRQIDSLSCGMDAYMAFKEASKINLIEYVEKHKMENLSLNNENIIDKKEKNDNLFNRDITINKCEHLPPSVAKYSQAPSLVIDHPELHKKFTSENHKPKTMAEYFILNKTIKSIPTGKKIRKEVPDLKNKSLFWGVEMNEMKTIYANAAIEKRRKKHVRTMNKMVADKSVDEIHEIIKKSSGIDLILKHIEQLKINESCTSGVTSLDPNKGNSKNIIRDYIEEEMNKRRDERTGMSPEGTFSLTDLAYLLQQMPKTPQLNKYKL